MPESPLLRHQKVVLTAIATTGQFKDDSLALFLADAGEPTKRCTVANWRAGHRSVSIGLLPIMLLHADDPAAILNVFARDHGLRVIADGAVETSGRDLTEQALDVSAAVGGVVSEVRQALADGRIEEHEHVALASRIDDAIRELHELKAVVTASTLRVVTA